MGFFKKFLARPEVAQGLQKFGDQYGDPAVNSIAKGMGAFREWRKKGGTKKSKPAGSGGGSFSNPQMGLKLGGAAPRGPSLPTPQISAPELKSVTSVPTPDFSNPGLTDPFKGFGGGNRFKL